MKRGSWWIAGGLLLIGSSARASNVGEIALVPDVGGDINRGALLGFPYLQAAACAFYSEHADQYDALFVFSAIPLSGLTRTQAGYATRSAAQGIGKDSLPNTTARYCAARLRHSVKMGDIQALEDDPDAIYTGTPGFTLSGVQVMAHEFGHQWLASVSFELGDGLRHCYLRGFPGGAEPPPLADCDGWRLSDFNQHWSAFFNSNSVMYGNQIDDLGGGQFRMSNPGAQYTELDQYLMGLRDAQEVGPMFVVDTGVPDTNSITYPVAGGTTQDITGVRRDISIDDIIRAEGPRVPPRENCHWKAAFLIVHAEGSPPSATLIGRVDRYRRRWETFYAEATDRRGSFDTTLAGAGLGTAECPGAATPPPADGGVPSADAGPSPDTGAIDSGSSPPPPPLTDDDAGTQVEPVPEPVGPERGIEEPKVIAVDDCACNAAAPIHPLNSSPSLSWLVLLALALRPPALRTRRR